MQRGHIVDHVERLRTKPEHIRMRMAMGASFGITGLVLLVWAGSTLTSGKLALNPFAQPSATSPATVSSQSVGSALVAGAADAVTGTQSAPALTAVDPATSTPVTSAPASDPTGGAQTVIPF